MLITARMDVKEMVGAQEITKVYHPIFCLDPQLKTVMDQARNLYRGPLDDLFKPEIAIDANHGKAVFEEEYQHRTDGAEINFGTYIPTLIALNESVRL
jgi:hypothetical protein